MEQACRPSYPIPAHIPDFLVKGRNTQGMEEITLVFTGEEGEARVYRQTVHYRIKWRNHTGLRMVLLGSERTDLDLFIPLMGQEVTDQLVK